MNIVREKHDRNSIGIANSILTNRDIPPVAMVTMVQIVIFFGSEPFKKSWLIEKSNNMGRCAITSALNTLEKLDFVETRDDGLYSIKNVPFIKCA